MKRIFPVIISLIALSMLGLILFQFLWLKSAHDFKFQQLSDRVVNATTAAGTVLSESHSLINTPAKPELLFPGDRIPFGYKKRSVINTHSKSEINNIIRNSFDRFELNKIPFEFAITENSINGDEIYSQNFYPYFQDSANTLKWVLRLTAESGTDLENLTNDEFLVVIVPNQGSIILKQLGWMIAGSVLFTLVIIAAFYLTVRTIFKQKKLSEIKNDFINNMTHEFKTPLATISLAVDALKNEKVVGDKEKTAYFSGIIKEENIRMNKQVETILQAALLDKQDELFDLKAMPAHVLIEKAISNIQLPLQNKGGKLEVHLDAANDLIKANDVHFTNLVNNLLDNALKYSKENPHIKLTTSNVGKNFKIKIEDNGIGMSKDTLNRIFEKFYRAHTGNVHDVKGFGLGLSYVKKMVLAHRGTIKAESTMGKCSAFTILIPIAT